MNFHPADPVSVGAFSALLVILLGAMLTAVYQSTLAAADSRSARQVTSRVGFVCLLYLGVFAAIGVNLSQQRALPWVPMQFAMVLAFSMVAARSKAIENVSKYTSVTLLVGFQAFRVPLELILHAWGEQSTIPMSMTWSGQNLDILSGVVAIALAPLSHKRWAAWSANIIGMVLLVNVMRVAIFSAPVPFGWDVTPKLLLFAYLPYAWIGPVCVGGALLGHVALTRKLIAWQAPSTEPSGITLEFRVAKGAHIVREYFTNVDKFVAVHPLIYRLKELGEGNFKVFERKRFGPLPIYFTYTARIAEQDDGVDMVADVAGMVRIEMNYRFVANSGATVVRETIAIESMLPVHNYLQRLFREQHELMFKNIAND